MSRYLVDEVRERCWFIDVAETLRDDELGFQLAQRASGDHQEANEILCASSTRALSYVARYRDSGSPHLTGKPIALVIGEASGLMIYQLHQIYRLLPSSELLVLTHPDSPLSTHQREARSPSQQDPLLLGDLMD